MIYFILYTILSFILFCFITVRNHVHFHFCPISHVISVIIIGGPIIWLFMFGVYIYSFYVKLRHKYGA
jgi:hypothetical protein